MNKHIDSIPAETMRALTSWHWPGNIRELENFIERSVILTRGTVLNVPISELRAIEPSTVPAKSAAAAAGAGGQTLTLHESEREYILKVLRETNGVLSGSAGAAARLGLKRTTLQAKMKKLGIDRDSI